MQAIASGLPLSTVWVRVERARAAAHWRPPAPGEGGVAAALDASADPQRTPLAADVAELLLPARAADAPLLLLQALRLVKVPLLPAAGYVTAALDPSNDAMGEIYVTLYIISYPPVKDPSKFSRSKDSPK